MDDEDDFRFSVVDVYDIAADIGKEFEKIIEQYGSEALTSLMPRVITALEQLERLAEKQETCGGIIDELRSTIATLEHQKLGLAEHRQRYARDLEDIERDMREEKQELSAKVSQLLDENRKLSSSLARSTDTTPCITDDESSLEPEVQREVVTRLQDAMEAQRLQLHRLQQQHQLQQTENDQLRGQVERLTQSNKDLRRRARQSTQQIRQLVEERAELQVTLQEQQRALDALQQRLGLAAKENFDLVTASTEPPDSQQKLVFDRNDPNRPRFTLTELKDILYQRNELKARLSDLEDELSVYRPANTSASKQQGGSHIICPPEEAHSSPLVDLDTLLARHGAGLSMEDPQPPVEDDPDDPPVQGPMPYEPDDAPWKRRSKESGIRKFFARMKKLSDVLLPSEDVVLGTPSPSAMLQSTPHHAYQYHSTPASTFSTPLNSMNVSSPPSLRSLPSHLNAKTPSTSTKNDRSLAPRHDSGYGSSMGLPLKNSDNRFVKLPSVSSSFTFEKFRMRFGLPPAAEANVKKVTHGSAVKTPSPSQGSQLELKNKSKSSDFGILAFEESFDADSPMPAGYTSDTRDGQFAHGSETAVLLHANRRASDASASRCNLSGTLENENVTSETSHRGNVIGTSTGENFDSVKSDSVNAAEDTSATGNVVCETLAVNNFEPKGLEKESQREPSAIPKSFSSPKKESTTIRNLIGRDKLAGELSSKAPEN